MASGTDRDNPQLPGNRSIWTRFLTKCGFRSSKASPVDTGLVPPSGWDGVFSLVASGGFSGSDPTAYDWIEIQTSGVVVGSAQIVTINGTGTEFDVTIGWGTVTNGDTVHFDTSTATLTSVPVTSASKFYREDGEWDTPPTLGITQLTGDVTTPTGGGVQPATIADHVITYGQIQHLSANNRLLGSGESGSGSSPAEITVSTGLTMTGTTLTVPGVATNATSIATNTSGIATNVTNITSNDTDIAANTSAIAGKQAADADLTALALITIAADQIIYGSGDVTWAKATITAFARSILDDADAAATRTTLGLGAVAVLASIANANMATVAASTVKGSVAGGTPADLSMTQLQSIAKVKLRVAFHADGGSSCQLGAHPQTEQFLKNLNTNIQIADLSTYSQVRLFCRIYTNSASVRSPRLIAKYHTSYTTTLATYSDIGTSEVSTSLASYTLANSGWIDLAESAKIDDCYITVTQIGGDESATPRVSSLMMEFR